MPYNNIYRYFFPGINDNSFTARDLSNEPPVLVQQRLRQLISQVLDDRVLPNAILRNDNETFEVIFEFIWNLISYRINVLGINNDLADEIQGEFDDLLDNYNAIPTADNLGQPGAVAVPPSVPTPSLPRRSGTRSVTGASEGQEHDCSICMEPLIVEGQLICCPNCRQTMHEGCAEEAANANPRCPLCRDEWPMNGFGSSFGSSFGNADLSSTVYSHWW